MSTRAALPAQSVEAADRASADGRSTESPEAARTRIRLSWGITVVALALALVHAVWPSIEIDNVTLALLAAAVLPWLGYIFKRIEMLGFVAEYPERAALQSAERQNEALQIAVSQATKAQARMQSLLMDDTPAPTAAARVEQVANATEEELEALVREYNAVRKQHRPGDVRTSLMTDVVGRMIGLVPRLQRFDVAQALRSSDGGRRLSAYAYLYAKPESDWLQELVNTVTEREDKTFGQYWGILAIGRVLRLLDPHQLPVSVLTQLRRYLDLLERKVGRGSDRYVELARIIRSVERPAEL